MINAFGISVLTMFGIGRSKFAPGSLASLVTCLIYFPIFIYKPNFLVLIIAFAIFSIYSIVLIDQLENKFKKKDPREIVIDEFIGQSIPIYLYEISHGTDKDPSEALIFYAVCFVLFRYFDIMKPFPVSYFDKKYKNSFGVIMDDVCAGFYVVLTLIIFMVIKSRILT